MIQENDAPCRACNGSGWIPVDGSLRVNPCSCQGEQKKRQRIASAAIPKRYLHCTLTNFSDSDNTTLRRARTTVTEFADCWPAVDHGLLLMGGCGAGKTHLAVAVLHELIISGKPGRLLFSNFQDLIQQIHASFGSDQVPDKSEILRPLIEADLLVLDELGSQKPTSFVQDVLYYVINSRYNDALPTIFTTNYFDGPQERDESLEQRIGQRLRSRLHEMCEPVLLPGVADYRKRRSRSL